MSLLCFLILAFIAAGYNFPREKVLDPANDRTKETQ
jgi:hypothetical protein